MACYVYGDGHYDPSSLPSLLSYDVTSCYDGQADTT